MKKTILKVAVCGLLAAVIAVIPNRSFGEDKKDEKHAGEAQKGEKSKRDTLPFHGKITSVDKAAKTVTIGQRTFQVTPDTKISKGGNPATLDDAAVDEEAGVAYKKSEDGKLTAVSLRFGPKPEAQEKPKKEKKEKKDK